MNRDYTVKTGKTINWDEVYSRLEAARVSAETTGPSSDDKKRILRERAREIALKTLIELRVAIGIDGI